MATPANLGDLKARIVSETVRDDLADDLKVQFGVVIRGAIEEWATQHFFFNEGRVVLPLTPGIEFVTLPTSIRVIDSVWLTVSGSRYDLMKRSMEEIEDLATSPSDGQPSDWCEFGGGMRLYPIPNLPCSLIIICVQDVTPPLDFVGPSGDVSTNAWSDIGQDLIVATSKKRLYRDYLSAIQSDPRLTLAITQEAEALSALTARSNRKIATGRIRPAW